jgi:hypothetical protein
MALAEIAVASSILSTFLASIWLELCGTSYFDSGKAVIIGFYVLAAILAGASGVHTTRMARIGRRSGDPPTLWRLERILPAVAQGIIILGVLPVVSNLTLACMT